MGISGFLFLKLNGWNYAQERVIGVFKTLTRNQEIFGQKLADYAVDCLWILVIVMQ